MTITCPKCKAKLKLSDEKSRQEGKKFRCAKCGVVLVYKGKGHKEEPVRSEGAGTALQPPLSAGISQSQGATETKDLTGTGEPLAGMTPAAAAEVSHVMAQVPVGIPEKEQALQMLKKTMAAREAERPGGEERKKGIRGKAVMGASLAGALALMLITIFIFRSPETAPQKQPAPASAGVETVSQPQAPSSPQENPPIVSPAVLPAEVPAVQASSATPEEKAVEMVKRSDVLMKMTSVEAIVDKWTQDNAGKYKVVGWQVKKIDDKQYLVSYTALDGNTPKGFYFVADIQGSTVEDLARNPELQKKYNIQYAR